jgi:beta-aspartyl-peptidase (threonine type)
MQRPLTESPPLISFALHGGAGASRRAGDDAAHRAALREIAGDAVRRLREGAPALDVVQAAVEALEDCPLFNAGIGAVLTRDGQPELDAAIMDGRDRRAGAVAGVQRARSPVRLARALLERNPHLFFSGPAADALCAEYGIETVAPSFFITPLRQKQLARAKARDQVELDHVADSDEAPEPPDDAAFGTVGAVACDADGHLAAATSTGGLTNKPPGRIGDSPLIGAGTYADDRSVAVSCTGTGESFIRACVGHALHARCLHAGESLAEAAQAVLADVRALGGSGGLIAIDREGRVCLPFNTSAMYRAWLHPDGQVRVGIHPDDDA